MTDNQIVTIDYLLKIINQNDINIKDLAEKSGVEYTNLKAILNKKRVIGDKTIIKLSKALDINYEELRNPPPFTAEERKGKYVVQRKNTYQADTVESPEVIGNSPKSLGKVPYYDIDVTAGNMILFRDNQEEVTDYYSVPKEISDVDFCFKVRGDSMYDKILPGAVVFVKEINDVSVIEYGQVFIVITAEQRMVKYVRRHPTKPDDMVLLRSHNNNYDDIDLMKNKITKLLLVKGYLNNYVL